MQEQYRIRRQSGAPRGTHRPRSGARAWIVKSVPSSPSQEAMSSKSASAPPVRRRACPAWECANLGARQSGSKSGMPRSVPIAPSQVAVPTAAKAAAGAERTDAVSEGDGDSSRVPRRCLEPPRERLIACTAFCTESPSARNEIRGGDAGSGTLTVSIVDIGSLGASTSASACSTLNVTSPSPGGLPGSSCDLRSNSDACSRNLSCAASSAAWSSDRIFWASQHCRCSSPNCLRKLSISGCESLLNSCAPLCCNCRSFF
mmetsp:Transcript_18200/g.52000  ORF Transcript_18200/g.52000 Transcript_18200/m.52000 type:complete len:259 (-) Transcript_18200:2259-3035(-)